LKRSALASNSLTDNGAACVTSTKPRMRVAFVTDIKPPQSAQLYLMGTLSLRNL